MLTLLRRLFGRSEHALDGLRATTREEEASNDFLELFAESETREIEISLTRVESRSFPYDVLSEIGYSKVRNRFRVLSNLDPVRNQKDEVGVIRFSYRKDTEMKDLLVESRFPRDTDTFYLKKK